MRILAVIPARGGSKGVPKKNIKLLGGKPLLAYTIESAKESKLLTSIVLSTESEEIANIGKEYQVSVPFLRPQELAIDTTPTLDVLKHAIEFYEKQNILFEAICILQPTSPFRSKGFIDMAIKRFKETNVDTLISVLRVPHEYNPHWVFEQGEDGLLKIATGEKTIISRRQDLPLSYYRDGSIYLVKTTIIKSHNTLFGTSISYIESSSEDYVNIDTLNDWEKAEKMINERFRKDK